MGDLLDPDKVYEMCPRCLGLDEWCFTCWGTGLIEHGCEEE